MRWREQNNSSSYLLFSTRPLTIFWRKISSLSFTEMFILEVISDPQAEQSNNMQGKWLRAVLNYPMSSNVL